MTTFRIDSTDIRSMAQEIMERMGYEDGETHIFEAAIEATVQAMLDNLGSDDVYKMAGFDSKLRAAQKQYVTDPKTDSRFYAAEREAEDRAAAREWADEYLDAEADKVQAGWAK